MMSFRNIARSAPRTLSRISSSTLRQTRIARPSPALKSTLTPLRPQFTSAFSTTPFRKASAGEVDSELSVKLESELQFEEEMKENDGVPASIKDFIENSSFEVIDEPGKEDVILKRQFGNETITVSFSISDLASFEPDLYNEDAALADEELPTEEAPGRTSSAAAEEEQEFGEEEEGEAPVPCRLNIVVEKQGKSGALNIEAVAQHGQIQVDNFYYFKDAKLAHSADPQASHAAQDAYPGPPFGSLDEDLQILMERYLEERGVTQALAVFVPDYMDFKEQKEYQTWLKEVKEFVDA